MWWLQTACRASQPADSYRTQAKAQDHEVVLVSPELSSTLSTLSARAKVFILQHGMDSLKRARSRLSGLPGSLFFVSEPVERTHTEEFSLWTTAPIV